MGLFDKLFGKKEKKQSEGRTETLAFWLNNKGEDPEIYGTELIITHSSKVSEWCTSLPSVPF